jgi:hypothetical protein
MALETVLQISVVVKGVKEKDLAIPAVNVKVVPCV